MKIPSLFGGRGGFFVMKRHGGLNIVGYGIDDFITHVIYVFRWVVLAAPGAILLQKTRKLLARTTGKDNITIAMLISQGVLGLLVYFIDRLIFK